jgi:hypothetical protein
MPQTSSSLQMEAWMLKQVQHDVGFLNGEFGVIILTGNDLASGDVVWWTGQGWSRQIGEAVNAGERADAILAEEQAAQRVNAAYEVEADANGMPLHIKDRVRAAGPSVRQDLGVNPAIKLEKA